MNESQRDDVWAKLPARLAALSVGVRLLPWTSDEVASWVAETISSRLGTWVIGETCAAAAFSCTSHQENSVEAGTGMIIARSADASFRLRLSDKLRAFAFAAGGEVVLGLPKARAAIATSSVIRALGSDADAINAGHRDEWLFDLGAGGSASRLSLRTNNAALARSLSINAGRPWSKVFPAIGADLASANPVTVVETAAARIEAFAPIAPPGSRAQADFVPATLPPSKDILAGLILPEYAVPVAMFCPASMSRCLAVPSSRNGSHLRC